MERMRTPVTRLRQLQNRANKEVFLLLLAEDVE
jgi:hypothetical protein